MPTERVADHDHDIHIFLVSPKMSDTEPHRVKERALSAGYDTLDNKCESQVTKCVPKMAVVKENVVVTVRWHVPPSDVCSDHQQFRVGTR